MVGAYPWETTSLKFAMNLHSHGGELTSGSLRYLAGADSDGSKLVESVILRNVKAQLYTKTSVEYDYWHDNIEAYDWNQSHKYILGLITSDSSIQTMIAEKQRRLPLQ
jgi:hypothetical protein